MADFEQWCKICNIVTGHTHIEGNVSVCAICGETNQVKNVAAIHAAIEKRRVESRESVERINGVKVSGQEEDRPRKKIKKEGDDMAKLTQEIRTEIVKRREAGEHASAVANALDVAVTVVYRVCKEEKRKARRGPAPAGVKVKRPTAFERSRIAPLPQPKTDEPSPLKLAIAVEVASQMAMIRQQIPAIVRDEIKNQL